MTNNTIFLKFKTNQNGRFRDSRDPMVAAKYSFETFKGATKMLTESMIAGTPVNISIHLNETSKKLQRNENAKR